jgi:hypothetical protein
MQDLRCPKKDLLAGRLIEAYRRLSDTEIFVDSFADRAQAEIDINAVRLEVARHPDECYFCQAIRRRETIRLFPKQETTWQGKLAS